MADSIAEKAKAVVADPAAGAGEGAIAAASDGMKNIMNMKIFGVNIFVVIALLVILGVIGFFAYKYFFAKKPKVPPKEQGGQPGPKGPAQGGNDPELDQVHAHYQQQMALQEQEYRRRLEQLQNAGGPVPGMRPGQPMPPMHEEEESEDSREIEVEDDPEDTETEYEDENEYQPEVEDVESSEYEDDDEAQPFRVEIGAPPQDVKVVRRGKKKGQEMTADDYARRASRLMLG